MYCGYRKVLGALNISQFSWNVGPTSKSDRPAYWNSRAVVYVLK